VSRPSSAQDVPPPPPPPPPPAVVDDVSPLRLLALLDDEAHHEHHQRQVAAGLWFGLAGLTAGLGVPCLAFQPSDSTQRGVFIAAGIGFEAFALVSVIGGLLTLALPTNLEKLAREYEPVAHGNNPDRLAWGEAHLSALADQEHSRRIMNATLGIVVGPLVIASGIVLGVAMPSGTDDVLRAAYIGMFSLLGFVDVMVGVIRLVSLDPAEQLWRTWRIGTGQSVSVSATPWVTPMPGGAATGLKLVF
jgi:hypothetical protein